MSEQELEADLVAEEVDRVPLDPGDSAWRTARTLSVSLSPQRMETPFGGGAVKDVDVSMLHDGEFVGVRLSWRNASRSDTVKISRFRDSCAIMFPALEGDTPPFTMGAEGRPVVIWQWKPDWEDPQAQEAARAARYPQYGDLYSPRNEEVFEGVGDRPRGYPVNVTVAEGFGSVTRTEDPDLEVRSRHTGDAWAVVFRRRLPAAHPPLKPGVATPFTLAVWDGASEERGGRKSVSLAWHTLRVEGDDANGITGDPEPRGRWIPGPAGVVAGATAAAVAWAIRRRMQHASPGGSPRAARGEGGP